MVFHHIGLNCKDMIATERFYKKHFGFERTRVLTLDGGKKIVFIKSGEVYLELFQAEGDAPKPDTLNDGPTTVGMRHLAFKVNDVDAKLEEMGDEAEVSFGPLSLDDVVLGWKIIWVKDPDGNIVEISQNYEDQENPPLLE